MKNLSELKLIQIAEMHEDDNIAAKAMRELRDNHDPTYIWCADCDGLVVKKKDCCLNKIKNEQ
jgi:hypothetical protein